MLDRVIVRQIDVVKGEAVSVYALILTNLIWAICLFAVIVSGRLLPTWMFVNSLQLITHLVLFQSQLPPLTALYLG
jgi:hypothetical protein